MHSALLALLVFAFVCGGALLGKYIGGVLPKEHLRDDTKHVIGASMGLIGSLTALLLAMVTTSAKESFDFEASQLRQTAVNVLMLDRLLADFGPDAAPIRRDLRVAVAGRIAMTWPETKLHTPVLHSPEAEATSYGLIQRIRELAPQNDLQRNFQSRAMQLTDQLMTARWTMLQDPDAAETGPFLVIVVCWLSLIFASFGLFAPANRTATVVLLISSLSVSASVFLILELETPFSGLIKVSGAPLRYALAQLGQ